MKILLVSHDFLPGLQGGMEHYYHQLCIHLRGEMQVLTSKRGDWATFDRRQEYVIHRRAVSVESRTFRRKTRVGISFLIYLAYMAVRQFFLYTLYSYQIVRQEKIALVLVGQLHLIPVGWLVRSITGRPYAVSLHGSALSRYWHFRLVRWLVIALLNRAEFLMVNSEFTRQQYLARGVRTDQTFVPIYPGVDVERFRPDVNPSSAIHRHKLAGRTVILTVARLVEWKGQDMVIQALSRVLKAVPNAVYVIVGDGPYRDTLEALAAELGLEDQTIFAGFVPDQELAQYYAAADVVALVSREIRPGVPIEGFGMVYLEANAAGRPVVGTRLGGAPEAVIDGITGLLVDPNAPQDIAEAIVYLLVNPELAQQMGVDGQARVRRDFTWKAQAAKLREWLSDRFPIERQAL